jgi:hypothetical protein
MVTTRSISNTGKSPVSGGCLIVLLVVFGVAFGATGLGVIYGTSVRPLMNVLSARGWQPAQCEVVYSHVDTSSGSGSRSSGTSRINIQYRYVWQDRTYNGARYDFMTGSDNINDDYKTSVVARHQPGQRVLCYVDPNDPSQSVINRDFRWGYLTGLAFGVPFASVPLLLIGFAVYARRAARRKQQSGVAVTGVAEPSPAASGGGPLVLKPEMSRLGRLAAMTFFCLVWNGITGLFTFFEFSGRLADAGWFLMLFLIPFQLIGLGLVWAVVRATLTLLNPKPTLTLSADSVPVGGSLTLQWELHGATGRLRNLTILLIGREEARYRRGTTTTTDRHTFYERPIMEASDTMRIERGMATLAIPRNTMHSFTADDNKIVWSLKVTGEIGFFPDVDETFDILVRPQ